MTAAERIRSLLNEAKQPLHPFNFDGINDRRIDHYQTTKMKDIAENDYEITNQARETKHSMEKMYRLMYNQMWKENRDDNNQNSEVDQGIYVQKRTKCGVDVGFVDRGGNCCYNGTSKDKEVDESSEKIDSIESYQIKEANIPYSSSIIADEGEYEDAMIEIDNKYSTNTSLISRCNSSSTTGMDNSLSLSFSHEALNVKNIISPQMSGQATGENFEGMSQTSSLNISTLLPPSNNEDEESICSRSCSLPPPPPYSPVSSASSVESLPDVGINYERDKESETAKYQWEEDVQPLGIEEKRIILENKPKKSLVSDKNILEWPRIECKNKSQPHVPHSKISTCQIEEERKLMMQEEIHSVKWNYYGKSIAYEGQSEELTKKYELQISVLLGDRSKHLNQIEKNRQLMKTLMLQNKEFTSRTKDLTSLLHTATLEVNGWKKKYENIVAERDMLSKSIEEKKSNLSSVLFEKNVLEVAKNELQDKLWDLKGNIKTIVRIRSPIANEDRVSSFPPMHHIHIPSPSISHLATQTKEDLINMSEFHQSNFFSVGTKIQIWDNYEIPCISSDQGNQQNTEKSIEKDYGANNKDTSFGSKTFEFDGVFGPKTTQDMIMGEVKPLLSYSLLGGKSCILCYGQTGSGKTYTMIGRHNENGEVNERFTQSKGIIYGVLDTLYAIRLSSLSHYSDIASRATDGISSSMCWDKSRLLVKLELEIFEVYQNTIYDLLNQVLDLKTKMKQKLDGRGKRDIKKSNMQSKEYDYRFDASGNVILNVTDLELKEVQYLLAKALSLRRWRATNANSMSSRSHCLFVLHITTVDTDKNIQFREKDTNKNNREGGLKGIKIGKLYLVDLAGSERLSILSSELNGSHTSNSKTKESQLKETQAINTSLLCLGNVIRCLRNRQPHVPYRDSKLTTALRDVFGGNIDDQCHQNKRGKALLICHLSPYVEDFHESLCSLRFANLVNECILPMHDLPKHRINGTRSFLKQKHNQNSISAQYLDDSSRRNKDTYNMNLIDKQTNQNTATEENLTMVLEEATPSFKRLEELREKSRLCKLKFLEKIETLNN